jgi:hypothetical protein
MGEGFSRHPSPIIAGGNTEQPSPARGEGAITATEIAARLNPRRGLASHDVKQPPLKERDANLLAWRQYVVNGVV